MPVTPQTALDSVINERFVPMIRALAITFTPPLSRVEAYADPTFEPPFGWVFPTGEVRIVQRRGPKGVKLAFGVGLRIAIGVGGYDGKLLQSLWLWLPTIYLYVEERRNLVYADGQNMPRYFDELQFVNAVPTSPSNPQEHVGVDLLYDFVFSFPISPVPGNI